MLVIKRNRLFDLRKLGLDPGVIDITMSVQFCKRLQALLFVAVVEEPTGTLGKEQNERDEDNSRDELDGERNCCVGVSVSKHEFLFQVDAAHKASRAGI